MFRNKIHLGFTLIEILVVVAIIGLLATLSIGPIRAAQQRNRDTQRKADINLIAQAIDLYYSENRTLPGSSTCTVDSTDNAPWITGLTARYLPSSNGRVLPIDPKQDETYHYTYTNLICAKNQNQATVQSGQSYILQAVMENKKDADSQTKNGKRIYEVVR